VGVEAQPQDVPFSDVVETRNPIGDAIRAALYPVVSLGYIGDGQRHPLSSITYCQGPSTAGWTLAQWKALFPKAFSLNDEIDGLAVQRFWDLRPKGGRLRLPDGFGYSSYEIQTGGAQCVSYSGTHRDTCGLIFVNSLASGGSGLGVSPAGSPRQTAGSRCRACRCCARAARFKRP
jgi:hypothetical protein